MKAILILFITFVGIVLFSTIVNASEVDVPPSIPVRDNQVIPEPNLQISKICSNGPATMVNPLQRTNESFIIVNTTVNNTNSDPVSVNMTEINDRASLMNNLLIRMLYIMDIK